ncbi:MAG TPA: ATP-dependent DNA helicase RecG, partial [Oscillospiraceae bacterium]|nr:ATP-dependent DNA helicase RecG [Oscillospiraceae bacterium]
MSALETPVSALRGVGPARAKSFARLGLITLRDLVGYFPRTYEDRSRIYAVSDAPVGENAAIRAAVASPVRTAHIRKGLDISKVTVADGTSLCELVFFNQSYVRSSLKEGEEYLFFGKVEGNLLRRSMQNPVFQRADAPPGAVGRISPVYPLTQGLTNPLVTRAVTEALAASADDLPEPLPQDLRQTHALCHARFAYENIHFPTSFEALETARRRLVFEELFTLSAGLSLLRLRREVALRPALPAVDMAPFYAALPFPLTNAQERVVGEALSDMTKTRPMNRLVQGDVGSGKTTVAAACAYFMAQNGRQTALMAPTELLAE